MRCRRLEISAALNWEFIFAGPPLCDFDIFLRYHRVGA
jgi:hypothetical protein